MIICLLFLIQLSMNARSYNLTPSSCSPQLRVRSIPIGILTRSDWVHIGCVAPNVVNASARAVRFLLGWSWRHSADDQLTNSLSMAVSVKVVLMALHGN